MVLWTVIWFLSPKNIGNRTPFLRTMVMSPQNLSDNLGGLKYCLLLVFLVCPWNEVSGLMPKNTLWTLDLCFTHFEGSLLSLIVPKYLSRFLPVFWCLLRNRNRQQTTNQMLESNLKSQEFVGKYAHLQIKNNHPPPLNSCTFPAFWELYPKPPGSHQMHGWMARSSYSRGGGRQ